ncbi:MAG: DUF2911 domain-containing protein [Planctomycetota bacterium]
MNHLISSLALLTAAGSAAFTLGPPSAPALQDGDSARLEFPAASPNATLQQRVGVTDVEVVYGRPSMKGRKVFGGLEPYGSVWRTGANAATRVTFSTDVTLGGAAVPAGTYALFSIPGEDLWTVILSKGAEQFGAYGYKEADDVARIEVKPETLSSPVETLAFGFSDLQPGQATMYFEWENTRVPMELDTHIVDQLQPRIEAAMAGDGEKPYVACAMFYYENGLDMDKAAEWMEQGVKAQPNAFWLIYRHGLILAKKGDKAGAIRAAEKSMELASQASGSLKAEYMRLNEALVKSCQ